jgi:fructose-1,6-bisphosphatase/inositol monophosphatase family enzyme
MDHEFWLKQCQEIGEKLFTEIKKHQGKDERQKILRTGFSGDKTSFLDDLTEKIILEHFKSTGKSFEFVSEEVGKVKVGDKPEVMIVVDPLDGSNNSIYGIPIYCSSISIGDLSGKVKGVEVGYIRNLIIGDVYHAVKGKGAFKNGEKISVSKEKTKFILVDIAANRRKNFERIIKLGEYSKSMRMLGSGSLSLCFFAEGTSHALVGLGGKRTLDSSAGQLIVKEAGGIIKDLDGKDYDEYDIGFDLDINYIAAPNEEVYSEIVSLLR